MSLRHKSREFALQMLFECDLGEQRPAEVEKHFWKAARAAESTRKFASELFEGALAQAEASDKLVSKLSHDWKLDRISAIDRNILRLAIYELKAGDTPPKVVIDEAIELAKKFSSDEAPGFLNGVLDAARKSFEEK
jgi:transcription antitermination protein NusB